MGSSCSFRFDLNTHAFDLDSVGAIFNLYENIQYITKYIVIKCSFIKLINYCIRK